MGELLGDRNAAASNRVCVALTAHLPLCKGSVEDVFDLRGQGNTYDLGKAAGHESAEPVGANDTCKIHVPPLAERNARVPIGTFPIRLQNFLKDAPVRHHANAVIAEFGAARRQMLPAALDRV